MGPSPPTKKDLRTEDPWAIMRRFIMGKFKNTTVWITGGGSGIGKALALAYARQGAQVAISGRRAERLEEVVQELDAAGGAGLAVPCDVTDDASVAAAVQRVVDRFGGMDIAIANAGMGVTGRFEQLTNEDWQQQMNVNVFGVINTARHAIPELKKTRGRLGFIGSVMSMICLPSSAAYSASKFAVRAIGLTLALELKNTGVSCTLIYPGFVESEISQVDNRGVFNPDRKDMRPKQLMWPAERAAKVIIKAIDKRKLEFTFTGHGKVGVFFGQHLPGMVYAIGGLVAGKRAAKMAANKS